MEGRNVLITGGSGGIGSALCLAFGAAGARVMVHANGSLASAEQVAAEIVAGGGEALALSADVASEGSVALLMKEVEGFADSRLDALVNAAGTYPVCPFSELTPTMWDEVIGVNLRGPFLCARAALPMLRRSGSGRIVNLGSGTVDLGTTGLAAYASAKSGLIGLSRVLARELAPDGITVNCVVPSMVETASADRAFGEVWDVTVAAQAIPRRQQPEDLIEAIAFFCGPASEWVTGQTVHADGGLVMR